MRPTLIVATAVALLPAAATASADAPAADAPADWYSVAFPTPDRAFNLPTARPVRRGSALLLLAPRSSRPMAEDPLNDFLGFDGDGIKVGIGLRYGLSDGVDVGVFRLNGTVEVFDTYELDLRYQLLTQEEHGIDVAARGGFSWFAQKKRDDALGVFAQLLANRVLFGRLLVGAGLLLHSDSSNDRKAATDPGRSLAAAATVEYRVTGNVAWDLEIAAAFAGYHSRYPTFSTGPKIITHRYTFAVAITNTQYIGADGILANTRRGSYDKLVLGINLTRAF